MSIISSMFEYDLPTTNKKDQRMNQQKTTIGGPLMTDEEAQLYYQISRYKKEIHLMREAMSQASKAYLEAKRQYDTVIATAQAKCRHPHTTRHTNDTTTLTECLICGKVTILSHERTSVSAPHGDTP